MSYQTGTATDGTDLLQKLSTFLTSAGWTINKDQAQGSGWWISAQKGSSLFANLVSDPASGTTSNPGPFIYLYGATGYSSGSAYNAQPGTSGQAAVNRLSGPFTKYYFFEGDDYCHIVIEVSAGVFRHIHIGTVEKACTFTGGHYFMTTQIYVSTTSPSDPTNANHNFPWETRTNTTLGENYVYANAGDGARWFENYTGATQGTRIGSGIIDSSAASASAIERRGLASFLFKRTPNVSNGITPLVPIFLQLEMASGLWCILGQAKDLRFVSLANYAAGETITIGSDEWLVFPYTARSETTGGSTSELSGYYGFAYKKNTA